MIGCRASLILLLVCLLGLVSAVQAQEDTRLNAILTLAPLEPQVVGSQVTINAQLVGDEGRPNPNKVLILYINGERIRQIRTDELGLANIRVSGGLPIGEYQIEVVFPGTRAYLSASASLTLTIRPIQLTVETVPPVANATFSLDGQTFVTDAEGLAQIDIAEPGTYQLQALDVTDIQVSEDTHVTFSRWGGSAFQPEQTIEALGDLHVQAGFATSHRVGLSFIDLDENEVSATRVTSVTLKRSDGSYHTFEDSEPQWLQATRIVRRREGLEASPLLYSVESVMVDGASIVNRYQQRFYVEPEDTWEIQLLFYSANIRAFDAIFGFPIGQGVNLEYPDGRVEQLQFGEDGEVYQSSLARGLYRLQVTGVTGISPVTPMALTRDQVVELKVLSALDIGVGVGLGITLAVGLLLYGRPRLLKPLLRPIPRARKPAFAPAVTYAHGNGATTEPIPDQPTLAAEASSNPEMDVPAITPPDVAIAWLMECFHPDGLKCPHCGHDGARVVGVTQESGLEVYRCRACWRTYNLYSGTPFAGSRLTPTQSARLLPQDSAQLARDLGLTKETVLKWQSRLQVAAGSLPLEAQLTVQTHSDPEIDAPAITSRDECVALLIEWFHPDGLKCPHCGHAEAHIARVNLASGLRVYRCRGCHYRYNLYSGTPFSGSQLTPSQSARLLREKSQNSAQLARELGLSKKTVKKWQRRLRAAGESLPLEAPPTAHSDEVQLIGVGEER